MRRAWSQTVRGVLVGQTVEGTGREGGTGAADVGVLKRIDYIPERVARNSILKIDRILRVRQKRDRRLREAEGVEGHRCRGTPSCGVGEKRCDDSCK